jgi:hypothetical protein
MISKSSFAIILIVGLIACGDPNPKPTELKPPEVPKALKNDKDSYEIISKRGKEDLVESLYGELAEKSPELNALERNIRNLQSSRFDSSKPYNNFNEQIQSYYGSAKNHLERISDSTLKEKIRQMLAGSLEKYHSTAAKHENLLKSIESKNLTLNDLHTLLKIVRTLPIMEKYQKENLPQTAPLEGFEKRLDETIKSADSLVKK